jgi:hypothetical protein
MNDRLWVTMLGSVAASVALGTVLLWLGRWGRFPTEGDGKAAVGSRAEREEP